jgi:hypothetical protein
MTEGEQRREISTDGYTPEAPGAKKAAAQAPPPKAAEEGRSFPLRKKIMAHGEELEAITLREPTAADINRCGYPVILRPLTGGGIQVTVDEEKMSAMISTLAVIPPSSVSKMHTRDWATVSVWLTSFFVPDWDQLQKA